MNFHVYNNVQKVFSRNFNILSSIPRHLATKKRNIYLSAANKNSTISSTQNKNDLIKIVVDPQTKIATLTMNRLPANALTTELMIGIKDSVNELERQKVQGIILTSSSDRIFCAGLDLNEAYNSDPEHLKKLWQSLQNMWKALFSTKLPTAALINGHAIAGGCVLSICCDYRVILPKLTIGLNETRVGIAVPLWVMDNYINIIKSRRIAEADLIEGRLYKSDGALQIGLVDAVVDTREQALEKCKEFLLSYDGQTQLAKAQTKLSFRSDVIKKFEQNREKDLNIFINGIQRKEVQEFLGNYLKGLKERSSQKKA